MVHLDTTWRFDRTASLTDRPDHPSDEVLAEGQGPLDARVVDELCGADDEDQEPERDRRRRGLTHQHRFADADFAVDSARNYHGVGEWR